MQPGMSQGDVQREAKRLAKRFKIVVLPFDPMNAADGTGPESD